MFLLVAIKCYHCIENTWSECQQKQTNVTCDDPFPTGNSHCYSVSGEYDNGTAIRTVVARGCVDCKGESSRRLWTVIVEFVTPSYPLFLSKRHNQLVLLALERFSALKGEQDERSHG